MDLIKKKHVSIRNYTSYTDLLRFFCWVTFKKIWSKKTQEIWFSNASAIERNWHHTYKLQTPKVHLFFFLLSIRYRKCVWAKEKSMREKPHRKDMSRMNWPQRQISQRDLSDNKQNTKTIAAN